MSIDYGTVSLLNSVLGSSTTRKLFTTIAAKRIAEVASLKQNNSDPARELDALQDADLIGLAHSGEKYYVTARGLKVARDLEKLSIV